MCDAYNRYTDTFFLCYFSLWKNKKKTFFSGSLAFRFIPIIGSEWQISTKEPSTRSNDNQTLFENFFFTWCHCEVIEDSWREWVFYSIFLFDLCTSPTYWKFKSWIIAFQTKMKILNESGSSISNSCFLDFLCTQWFITFISILFIDQRPFRYQSSVFCASHNRMFIRK